MTVPLVKQCTTCKDVKIVFIFGRMLKLLEEPFVLCAFYFERSAVVHNVEQRGGVSLLLCVESRIGQRQITF